MSDNVSQLSECLSPAVMAQVAAKRAGLRKHVFHGGTLCSSCRSAPPRHSGRYCQKCQNEAQKAAYASRAARAREENQNV